MIISVNRPIVLECECGNPSNEVEYSEDTGKPHYHCCDCGGAIDLDVEIIDIGGGTSNNE